MDTLDPVHERGAQLIYQQGHPQKSNGLPISYIFKRHLLLLMYDVFQDKVSNSINFSPSSKQRCKEDRLIGATKLKSQE